MAFSHKSRCLEQHSQTQTVFLNICWLHQNTLKQLTLGKSWKHRLFIKAQQSSQTDFCRHTLLITIQRQHISVNAPIAVTNDRYPKVVSHDRKYHKDTHHRFVESWKRDQIWQRWPPRDFQCRKNPLYSHVANALFAFAPVSQVEGEEDVDAGKGKRKKKAAYAGGLVLDPKVGKSGFLV